MGTWEGEWKYKECEGNESINIWGMNESESIDMWGMNINM